MAFVGFSNQSSPLPAPVQQSLLATGPSILSIDFLEASFNSLLFLDPSCLRHTDPKWKFYNTFPPVAPISAPLTPLKRDKPTKSRQSRNSFLVFRHEFMTSVLGTTPVHQTDVSRAAAAAWRTLSDSEKAPWKDKAELEKRMVATYGDELVAKPARKNKKGRGAGRMRSAPNFTSTLAADHNGSSVSGMSPSTTAVSCVRFACSAAC